MPRLAPLELCLTPIERKPLTNGRWDIYPRQCAVETFSSALAATALPKAI